MNNLLNCIVGFHIGSFLLCFCKQFIQGKYRHRSVCSGCGRVLKWYELVPVFSYLLLRGKCRSCRQRIGSEVFLAELVTGAIMTAGLYRVSFASWQWLQTLLIITVLWCVCYIDWKTRCIPDCLHACLLGIYFADAVLLQRLNPADLLRMGMILVIGLSCSRAASYLFHKECIGDGDIKLLAMLGMFVSWRSLWLVLCLSSCLALAVMLWKKEKTIAFGPFIVFAFLPVFCGYLSVFAG